MKKDQLKILAITQYFPPDISGGSTRAYNYCKSISEQGYDVTVITAYPHQHGPVPKEYKWKLRVKEKMENLTLFRVWIPSLLHTSIRNNLILLSTFLLTSLFPLFRTRPDIIILFEPNLFSIIPGYIYSKCRGGKIIRVVDDLWPEILYERGYVKSKFSRWVLDRLTRLSYEFPKYLIPLNEEVKQVICKDHNTPEEKIKSISHGIDTKIFQYHEYKRKEEFIAMYSGSLVESYDFDIIINAAKKLENEKIKFIIRGKGKLLPYIEDLIKKLQVKNVVLDTDFIPLRELSETLAKADVLLSPMGKGKHLNFSLPTKILEYQSVGRPIVCSSNGAIGKYIESTGSGIRTEHENVDDFVEAITKLMKDEELCRKLGMQGRKNIEEFHDIGRIGEQLSEIIKRTIKE
ncbi:MAG: glycosyltransferase family 4 protein [Nitrosarchaeum sp.]|nr:glycosyltransferase family 4 protein [Nitrosarchaeum sp.]